MPVRSTSSSVLEWPDLATVRDAVERWGLELAHERPELLRVGYFGSAARGDWGVGSDLDLVIVVEESPLPWSQRSAGWDTTALPVPADLIVYTRREWDELDPEARFSRTLAAEARWIVDRL